MVTAWIYLFLCLPALLLSAEFTASVSRNEVALGECVTLDLALQGASPKASPSLDSLRHAFLIRSQQQAFHTRVVNGAVSSHLTWTFVLAPRAAGEVQIPPIELETSEGRLVTEPIAMQIVPERSSPGRRAEGGIRLETEVSRSSPYKNEPFFLTVRLLSAQTLANVQVEKFEVEGAIVEPAGEPRMGERIENGVRVGVVEFQYLLTPLKPGSLHIPSLAVQGSIPQRRSGGSLFGSDAPFDDPFAPFSLMQGLSAHPFVVTAKERVVEVRPPEADAAPWLPAQALEIREKWEGAQTFQQGEPFTRSLVISAEGLHSSQLPSLEGKQGGEGQFKIYADKPQLKDEIVEGKLKSCRIESYTLIPQRAGEVTLPEIALPWWNTEKGERREARVAARSLQVLPASASPGPVLRDVALVDDLPLGAAEEKTALPAIHPLLYLLIGGLALLLALLLSWIIVLQRKMQRLKGNVENHGEPHPSKLKKGDFDLARAPGSHHDVKLGEPSLEPKIDPSACSGAVKERKAGKAPALPSLVSDRTPIEKGDKAKKRGELDDLNPT